MIKIIFDNCTIFQLFQTRFIFIQNESYNKNDWTDFDQSNNDGDCKFWIWTSYMAAFVKRAGKKSGKAFVREGKMGKKGFLRRRRPSQP